MDLSGDFFTDVPGTWAEMIQRLGSPVMVYGRAYMWLLHATQVPSQHGGLKRVRYRR